MECSTCSVIVDAGCKTGDWAGLINHFPFDNVIRIGVDPIDYKWPSVWNFYQQCAIDNVDKITSMDFHLFDEPGCNSLLPKIRAFKS